MPSENAGSHSYFIIINFTSLRYLLLEFEVSTNKKSLTSTTFIGTVIPVRPMSIVFTSSFRALVYHLVLLWSNTSNKDHNDIKSASLELVYSK